MEKKEIWKKVPGYEEKYEVSSNGRVKSLDIIIRMEGRNATSKFEYDKLIKGKILNIHSDKWGYPRVNLNLNKRVKTFHVHKLMAMTFLNHKPSGHKIVVDHIDNNKKNNVIDNLQLVSQRVNCTKDIDLNKTSSKYIGVDWDKSSEKWRSRIWDVDKRLYLGCFDTEEEAHNAYQNKLRELDGH